MKRRTIAAPAVIASLALALAGCSGGTEPTGNSTSGSGGAETITMSAWNVAATPEFQVLVDGFNATGPEYEVEIVEYDTAEYDTQMVADLAAGTAPDIVTQKNQSYFYTYADGGQLMDVSDILGDIQDNASLELFQVDGATYAVPYRQDQWILFYNKDLFAAAGVEEPNGAWTWDDYEEAAAALTTGVADSSGAFGTYQHSWNASVQGFANAQVDGADPLSGDFEFYQPYYERALRMQDDGSQETFGNTTTNQLHYTSEFGTQKAAMTLMGSWFVASLIAMQESGDADDFEWSIAPAPQLDASLGYPDGTPRTFGNPTGLGINPAIDEAKVATAKEFLTWSASSEAAQLLAGIGITPAIVTDEVVEAFFATEGAPQDDVARWTFSNRQITPEHPNSAFTPGIWTILGDMHSAIMSESEGVDPAISAAQDRAANEVLDS
ncbi:MAG: ABC transporter substrate-binding protein [Arachnia sp.]